VTKRISETVALRARDLKIDYLFQGADNKSDVLDKILTENNFLEDEVAYVGDDIIDLPIMQRCGWPSLWPMRGTNNQDGSLPHSLRRRSRCCP